MKALIFIGVLTLLPVVAICVLRANAMIVFLSLCLGYVLSAVAYQDVNTVLVSFSPRAGELELASVKLALIMVPFVLAIFLTAHSSWAKNKLFGNLLLAGASAVLFSTIAKPLLPRSAQMAIEADAAWTHIDALQTPAVIAATIGCVLLMLSAKRARTMAQTKSTK